MPAELSQPAVAPRPSVVSLSPSEGARVVCREALTEHDRAEHFAIRRRIFVEEQEIFSGSDVDVHDRDGAAIALIGYCAGVAAGTVRLYALGPSQGSWQGDRLAVLAPYRMRGVGAPLVRCAVATAAVLGGRVMTAHIQPANVGFFRRLGWMTRGEVEIYAGLIHQPMTIDLPRLSEARATLRRLAEGVSARAL